MIGRRLGSWDVGLERLVHLALILSLLIHGLFFGVPIARADTPVNRSTLTTPRAVPTATATWAPSPTATPTITPALSAMPTSMAPPSSPATGLSTTPGWIVDGAASGSTSGLVVAAGDVNGDGYPDVLVGSERYDGTLANQGRARLYYGSPSGPGTTPNWTAIGDAAGVHFGGVVSGAGDVNGDGYDDVIISAPLYTNDQSEEGRVYVYYGSASGLSATAGWMIEGNQGGAHLGTGVRMAGDVNGDGYDDIVIGSGDFNLGKGAAWVYLGSAIGLTASPDWAFLGDQEGGALGESVTCWGHRGG